MMFLFDIDGTLLSAGGAGSRAINRVFESRYGVREAMKGVSAGGKTDDMILRECSSLALGREVTTEEAAGILEAYLPLLKEELLAPSFRLLPFATECLTYLGSAGSALGIATGNIRLAADAKLERGGISHFFPFGGYGCDSPRRAELVEKGIERGIAAYPQWRRDDVVVVGDTVHDVEAARACRVTVVAVTTGSASRDDLARSEPDALLENLEELPAWYEARRVAG